MEIGIIYVIPIVSVILALLGWFIADRRAGDRIEAEIEDDKRRIDSIADRIVDSQAGISECERTAERVAEAEQRTENKISVASESVGSAKSRSEKIECLADECLAIIETAEKTEE